LANTGFQTVYNQSLNIPRDAMHR